MKIYKPVENWTKYPNCILDNLDKFKSNEIKIISLMVRKNHGFDNPNCKFSVRYISKKTNLSRPTVMKAIDNLIKMESIKVVGTAERGLRLFNIKWEKPLVKNIDRSNSFTSTGKISLPDPVKNIDQVKEQQSKIKHNKKNNTLFYNSIIDYFNITTGKKIKYSSTNYDLIKAVFKKGITEEEFKRVISYKNNEWKNNPDMKKFIQLSTFCRPSNIKRYVSDSEGYEEAPDNGIMEEREERQEKFE
ncbi:MAG: conserved phage C-terminal domain-containing protein [Calditrichia bacterium]|nr:conserved phage C-terminal domain-containing protein [Calditrichia bacterium]